MDQCRSSSGSRTLGPLEKASAGELMVKAGVLHPQLSLLGSHISIHLEGKKMNTVVHCSRVLWHRCTVCCEDLLTSGSWGSMPDHGASWQTNSCQGWWHLVRTLLPQYVLMTHTHLTIAWVFSVLFTLWPPYTWFKTLPKYLSWFTLVQMQSQSYLYFIIISKANRDRKSVV